MDDFGVSGDRFDCGKSIPSDESTPGDPDESTVGGLAERSSSEEPTTATTLTITATAAMAATAAMVHDRGTWPGQQRPPVHRSQPLQMGRRLRRSAGSRHGFRSAGRPPPGRRSAGRRSARSPGGNHPVRGPRPPHPSRRTSADTAQGQLPRMLQGHCARQAAQARVTTPAVATESKCAAGRPSARPTIPGRQRQAATAPTWTPNWKAVHATLLRVPVIGGPRWGVVDHSDATLGGGGEQALRHGGIGEHQGCHHPR